MCQQRRTAEGNEEEFRRGCGFLRQERQALWLYADRPCQQDRHSWCPDSCRRRAARLCYPRTTFDRIEAFIDQLLTLNPKITQGEIFQKLKKQRAYIKKGVIYYDGQSRPLPPFMAKAIDRNNRISFIEKFHPKNEAEVEMLCKAFKVDRPDLVDIYTERPPKYADSVSRLHVIFNDSEVKSPRSAMYQGRLHYPSGG